MILFTGICMADEAPSSVVYVQGGESTFTNGSDGMYVLTVQDVIPYIHVTDGVRSHLEPVQLLPVFTYPINAALVLPDADGESVSLLMISNATILKDKKELTLKISPLQYYDGQMLKSFVNESKGIDTLMDGKHNQTAIYLEMNQKPLVNGCGYPCPFGCFWSEADKSCWFLDDTDSFTYCPGC
jgi:hypothetical protein